MTAGDASSGAADVRPNILIIDDSIDSIHVLSRVLDSEGEIRFALTGRKGVDLARHQLPDLVLLDIELGDTSGFAVMQQLLEIDGMADVPVLFVSFHDDSLMEISALRAGAEGLLSKVASPNTIRRRVQEFLTVDKSASADESAVDEAPTIAPCVLLVEPGNVLALAPMAAIMQSHGAEVILAGQYRDMKALVGSRPVHLVILVANEGDDSWIEECKQLQIDHPDVVLAVASDEVTTALEDAAITVGSKDVFERKTRPMILKARLKHVLELIPRSALVASEP